jgi:hypothetical protein
MGILTLGAFGATDAAVWPRVFILAAACVVGFVVLQLGLPRRFGV